MKDNIMKIIQSYEIANVSLTMEKVDYDYIYFVIVKRGGKDIVKIYYGDDQSMAANQFNVLRTLVTELIRG